MEKFIVLLAVVPSVLSCGLSVFYAYLAYKKTKEEPKDEVWETATRMLCAQSGAPDSDDFAELYLELKFLKENPELCHQHRFIRKAMEAKKEDTERK